jgi:uncharacterized membrane protein YbhN (UPF0104 family)
MARLFPKMSGSHMDRKPVALSLLITLTALLMLAGIVGAAYIAGFSAVRDTLGRFQWPWVIGAVGALVVSFVGYYYAYRGVYDVDSGPQLSGTQMRAVVAAGFGGFLAHGGSALDDYALRAAGASDKEAKVRVSSLGGMEHGILAIIGTAAGIAVLTEGLKSPPLDFSLPWAVIPVPGFLIAFWLAGRYRHRLPDQGWRGKVKIFLNSIYLIREMFTHLGRQGGALLGMAVFWVAEMFMGWAGMAAFGFHMNAAQFIIGFGTGMVFTRRTGPLGGAGVLDLVLPITVWYSGAPFATAVVGIFVYRVLSVWLPMPFGLYGLPALRRMGHEKLPHAEGTPAGDTQEPAIEPQPAGNG